MFLFLILLDQGLKFVFVRVFPDLVYPGKGFILGIGDEQSVFYVAFTVLCFLLAFLLFFAKKTSGVALNSSIFILAGGFSNVIDRLAYGAVVDFIPFFNLSYFNLADFYVVVGVLVYGYNLLGYYSDPA